MIGEFWIVSAPGEKTCQETWDRLNRATGEMSQNHKFAIPDLKVGTLDQLVGLSDDLAKVDTYAEGTTRKLVQYFNEVLEAQQDKLFENLQVQGKDMVQYLTKFQWDSAKYPVKQSLRNISEIISKQISQIDNDLKAKATSYNNLKNNLSALERKATGSLLTKELGEIVKKEDFVLDSEYLQTLLVVVPKAGYKEWETQYWKFTDMVVPGSSKLVHEDQENGLFTVTLFKKVIEDYKVKSRNQKFIVRDFVYDEEALNHGKNERNKLTQEKNKQFGPLVRWLKINFSELFSAWIHVKALRVFVESVLRYGLPVNFQAMFVQPNKRSLKKLREALNQLYAHLDSGNMGGGNLADMTEDMPTLMSLGQQDYYPYVFFKMNVDLVEGLSSVKER
jgi:V-type H+-transporting ATPase subunit C